MPMGGQKTKVFQRRLVVKDKYGFIAFITDLMEWNPYIVQKCISNAIFCVVVCVKYHVLYKIIKVFRRADYKYLSQPLPYSNINIVYHSQCTINNIRYKNPIIVIH